MDRRCTRRAEAGAGQHLPPAPVAEFAGRGGRFGAHNLHENRPVAGSWISDTIIFGTFFNAGVRVFDLSDPFRPHEIAFYVPEPPRGSPAGTTQLNDVFVDERGVVYAVDRFTGGLYIFEVRV